MTDPRQICVECNDPVVPVVIEVGHAPRCPLCGTNMA